MDKLFIKEKYLKELLSVFENYCPKAEIWAYGSRVEGDAHSGSDLDLAVKTFGENTKDIIKLRKFLNESNIPFLIEIFEFNKLPESFQKEIERKHVIIFPLK